MELYSIASESLVVCKIETGGNVQSTHSSIRLSADSEEELQQWISAIEQSSWMGEYQEVKKEDFLSSKVHVCFQLIQLQSNRIRKKWNLNTTQPENGA